MSLSDYINSSAPNPKKYEWKCPRDGCKYVTTTYTESGLKSFSEAHLEQHKKEDRERTEMTAAMIVFKPKNYNVLLLTAEDIGFLKTRGIKLDSNIEYDPTIEPKRTTEELSQSRWAAILRRAWNR